MIIFAKNISTCSEGPAVGLLRDMGAEELGSCNGKKMFNDGKTTRNKPAAVKFSVSYYVQDTTSQTQDKEKQNKILKFSFKNILKLTVLRTRQK